MVPCGVELVDHWQPRQGSNWSWTIAHAKSVVEAIITGAFRDEVGAGPEGVRAKRGGPVAVDSGTDYPVVGEVVGGFMGGYELQAALYQVEVVQQPLQRWVLKLLIEFCINESIFKMLQILLRMFSDIFDNMILNVIFVTKNEMRQT